MNPSTSDEARPLLEVRDARASSVIVQRIDPGAVAVFMEWQRGITAAAAEFPGYQATEMYPPADQQDEWVVILHFDDSRTLQTWLDSPTRADWLAQRPPETGDYRLQTLPSGFGAWFAGLPDASGATLPPSWKIALSVLLPLYPTVMVLIILDVPPPGRFGLAVTMLISNVLSIAILQWAVTPALNVVLAPWLRANGRGGRRVTLVGLVLILATLGVMTALFSLITG
jgi:antibiotic biosynthesis monooxygenase (ABM) superfamily enzyme